MNEQGLLKLLMEALRKCDITRVPREFIDHPGVERVTMGVYAPDEKHIYIGKDVKKETFERIFLHELAHYYHDKHKKLFLTEEREESEADKLSDTWYKLIHGGKK